MRQNHSALDPLSIRFEEKGFSEAVPVRIIRKTFPEPHIVRTHYHQSFEINICKEVQGSAVIDNRQYDLFSSPVLLLPPEVLHSYTISRCSGSILVIHISLRHLKKFLNTPGLEKMLKSRNSSFQYASSAYNDAVLKIEALGEQKSVRPIHAASLLLEIIEILIRNARSSQKNEYGCDEVKKIIQYTEKNFLFPISLDDMCKLTGFSRSYFCRYFKNKTGQNFISFLTDLRLEYSIELLQSGTSVTAAAVSSGFNDSSYYIKRFREKYGMSPAKFRKENSFLT